MKVLFTANFPSPYRIDFFNELGKYCDLTVAYEREKALHRDAKWTGSSALHYRAVYLPLKPSGIDRSRGSAIVELLKHNAYDFIIFSGYASPSVMRAIGYCLSHKRPYYLEYDGRFNKKDAFFKRIIKKKILTGASGHFITCGELRRYLRSYRVDERKLFTYPFSSLKKQDILHALPSPVNKRALKIRLGIKENKAILSVGQFIPRKGFDVLLRAAESIDRSIGIYIVGGKPTEEYTELINALGLTNVHFVEFMRRENLRDWYAACDLFVHPAREDIWGLVINEAMASGLPVISTDRCIAALELIREGENGHIVPTDDPTALAEKINEVIHEDAKRITMGSNSLAIIADYTIENMAMDHYEQMKRLSERTSER